jgi:hypothetical protein
MKNFYEISKKEKKDGFYHLHGLGCEKSKTKQKKYKMMGGVFQNSLEALEAAKKIHPNIKTCRLCCPSCHEEK